MNYKAVLFFIFISNYCFSQSIIGKSFYFIKRMSPTSFCNIEDKVSFHFITQDTVTIINTKTYFCSPNAPEGSGIEDLILYRFSYKQNDSSIKISNYNEEFSNFIFANSILKANFFNTLKSKESVVNFDEYKVNFGITDLLKTYFKSDWKLITLDPPYRTKNIFLKLSENGNCYYGGEMGQVHRHYSGKFEIGDDSVICTFNKEIRNLTEEIILPENQKIVLNLPFRMFSRRNNLETIIGDHWERVNNKYEFKSE